QRDHITGRERCSSRLCVRKEKENVSFMPFTKSRRNDSTLLPLQYDSNPVSLPQQVAGHRSGCSYSPLEQFRFSSLVIADVGIENNHHVSDSLRLHLVHN